jgi:hypothetical protein
MAYRGRSCSRTSVGVPLNRCRRWPTEEQFELLGHPAVHVEHGRAAVIVLATPYALFLLVDVQRHG